LSAEFLHQKQKIDFFFVKNKGTKAPRK